MPTTHHSTPVRPLEGLRLLIVEDEFLIAADLRELLDNAGASSALACTPEKALTLIGAESFDGAFLDVHMGVGTSAEVARVLHAKGVPFIVVTGSAGGTRRGDLAHAPALYKPFSGKEVVTLATIHFVQRESESRNTSSTRTG